MRKALTILIKFLAGLFIGMHIYALALKVLPAPGTFLMLQRAVEGEHVRRTPVALEDISPHLVRAVIAAEDSRFCQHEGVDPDAIRTAIKEYEDGRGLRGASTITQQTAKNVFLWNGGGAPRKAADAWMALFIDWAWGKRRVMETYLNVAEWGDGLFGAEAAAQARFGKPASDLTRREAALLAAVLPSPNKWSVDPPGTYVSGYAGRLQARMRVVEADRLDACVWGEKVPEREAPARVPVSEERPAPAPAEDAPLPAPDMPAEEGPPEEPDSDPGAPLTEPDEEEAPAPEEDLAPMPSPNDEATDALNDVLEAAEGSFGDRQAGDGVSEAAPEPDVAPEPETGADEDAAPEESSGSGPTDLRPRRPEDE